MTDSEEIHRSVADADDLKELRGETIPLADVFRSPVRHPAQVITRRDAKAALPKALFLFSVL